MLFCSPVTLNWMIHFGLKSLQLNKSLILGRLIILMVIGVALQLSKAIDGFAMKQWLNLINYLVYLTILFNSLNLLLREMFCNLNSKSFRSSLGALNFW